ncbi:MAG: phycobiliprotein lyase [Cyanobacteria bacterium P01_G01_bin.54]
MPKQTLAPMNMMDFFRKSEGIWLSQRTVHHFDTRADESGESNLIIDVLAADDERVKSVCSEQNIDSTLAVGGASFLWQHNLEDTQPNPDYAAVLVDLPNPDNPTQGAFLRNRGYVEGIPVICQYHFAPDGVLTINTEYERNQGTERCWFINDNFRVRITMAKMMNGVNLMGYCSERRCTAEAEIEAALARNRDRAQR